MDSADPSRGALDGMLDHHPRRQGRTGSLAMLEGEGEFMNGDDAPSERLHWTASAPMPKNMVTKDPHP